MNYELAKELKDAGFPQKKLEISGVYAGICKHGMYGFSEGRESCDCGEEETVHFPTLEELIEACGDGFDGLMSQKRVSDSLGEWVAMKDRYKSLDECFFGKTPTEAVARLWLALNKK